MHLADAIIHKSKSVFHFDPSIVFYSVVLLLKTVDRGGGDDSVCFLIINWTKWMC